MSQTHLLLICFGLILLGFGIREYFPEPKIVFYDEGRIVQPSNTEATYWACRNTPGADFECVDMGKFLQPSTQTETQSL